eukprot:6394389-Prymnesium_polylepis.1
MPSRVASPGMAACSPTWVQHTGDIPGVSFRLRPWASGSALARVSASAQASTLFKASSSAALSRVLRCLTSSSAAAFAAAPVAAQRLRTSLSSSTAVRRVVRCPRHERRL